VTRRSKQSTQFEVIVECWEKLDADFAGRRELQAIATVLRERFGAAAPSPAAIARTLANHGVPLSHPDVLETDTTWREHHLVEIVPAELDTIDAASVAIEKLRSMTDYAQANGIDQLRLQVREIKEELEQLARSEVGNAHSRAVAAELAAWLTVWLQNPSIFDDWLTLRRDSPDFLQKFR
jgi:hypothetical protein